MLAKQKQLLLDLHNNFTSDAATGGMFLKISQISQENSCVGVSF